MPVTSSEHAAVSSHSDQHVAAIHTTDDLLRSLKNPTTAIIVVEAMLSDVPGFRLSPHQEIRGGSSKLVGLKFRPDSDGIELSSDNSVSALKLVTDPDRCAIWNDESVEAVVDLFLHFVKMFRPNSADQPDDCRFPVGLLFNLQTVSAPP